MVEIFSTFIKLPYADRFVYSQQVRERNSPTTTSLPAADQSRMPKMLEPYQRTPEQYATANGEALERCVQAEQEERHAVEDEGMDWYEDD